VDDRPPYLQAQKLDPLGVDAFMRELPEVTTAGQVSYIMAQLSTVVQRFEPTIYTNTQQSFAALRDLDFMITSASMHIAGAYKQVDGLECILTRLGACCGHYPRGSNFTYGLFNPSDVRMRTFTGLDEERTFIRAIQVGTHWLDDALLTVRHMSTTPVDSLAFEKIANELVSQFESMVTAAVSVHQSVSPEVFSRRIVRFFIPLDIGGIVYPSITGAQVQNLAIDYLIFGADLENDAYQEYARDHLEGLLPFHKAVVNRTLRNLQARSLLTAIAADVTARSTLNVSQAERSLASLHRFLQRVFSFRMAHRRLAIQNLPLRQVEVGSGGYSLDFLEHLITQTRGAAQRTVAIISELRRR